MVRGAFEPFVKFVAFQHFVRPLLFFETPEGRGAGQQQR